MLLWSASIKKTRAKHYEYSPNKKKYAAKGRPGASNIARLIGTVTSEQTQHEFVKQLAFNIAIFATNAHTKKKSLLEYPNHVEPAPPTMSHHSPPYSDFTARRPFTFMRVSMPIGGKNRFEKINTRIWQAFTRANSMPMKYIQPRRHSHAQSRASKNFKDDLSRHTTYTYRNSENTRIICSP